MGDNDVNVTLAVVESRLEALHRDHLTTAARLIAIESEITTIRIALTQIQANSAILRRVVYGAVGCALLGVAGGLLGLLGL